MGTWVVINGSPRLNGKSARVVRMLKLSIEQSHPEAEVLEFEVGRMDVSGCNGCEFCRTNDECIIEDDMAQLIDALNGAERVLLVTPIYFAGAPSQLKAVLDRLQPFFWPYLSRKAKGEPLRSARFPFSWWAMAATRTVTSRWSPASARRWPLRALLLKKPFRLSASSTLSANIWESGVLPDGQAFIFGKRCRDARRP